MQTIGSKIFIFFIANIEPSSFEKTADKILQRMICEFKMLNADPEIHFARS